MAKFKDSMVKFKYGRYGVDHFSRLLIGVSVVLLVVTLFWYNTFFYVLGIVLMAYVYFRTFSKNVSKRYAENQVYLKYRYKLVAKCNTFIARLKDSKTHRIFKCPGCGQKIRVPRHKGKISIKCPKCRIEFIKKT